MSERALVRVMPLPDSSYGLNVYVGATPGEIVAVAATLPPAAFIAPMPIGRQGVVLLFRRFPKGVPDPSAPAGGSDDPTMPGVVDGWVPDVTGATDQGLSPYQVAAGVLLTATDDPALGARIFDLVRREDPATVVALSHVVRPRGCRCDATG